MLLLKFKKKKTEKEKQMSHHRFAFGILLYFEVGHRSE
jgi:hypothetical protein